MTLKSDDVFSRRRLFSLLTKEGRVSNKDFRLRTGTFNMLINQLKALGLSFDFGYSVQKEEKRDESSEKKFEEN